MAALIIGSTQGMTLCSGKTPILSVEISSPNGQAGDQIILRNGAGENIILPITVNGTDFWRQVVVDNLHMDVVLTTNTGNRATVGIHLAHAGMEIRPAAQPVT